ncbi:MAG: hypothetical protein ABSG68_15395 [Thermoguttaceae bacterium]
MFSIRAFALSAFRDSFPARTALKMRNSKTGASRLVRRLQKGVSDEGKAARSIQSSTGKPVAHKQSPKRFTRMKQTTDFTDDTDDFKSYRSWFCHHFVREIRVIRGQITPDG